MRTIRSLFLPLLAVAAFGQTSQLITLIGPPGAGKTTQADILKKDLGCAVVSVDDLIAQNPQALEKARRPEIQGIDPRVDPALNKLVEEKLRSIDVSKCLVLDGYPAAKEHGDYLPKLIEEFHLPRPVVIHLQVPDGVVRKRLKKEKPEELEQRLKDYHRELDFARIYFPNADIHDIDGTQKPEAVAKEIRKVLASRGLSSQ